MVTASGVRFHPDGNTLSILLNFKPIKLQQEEYTLKFLLKNYFGDDIFRNEIQCATTIIDHPYNNHFRCLKSYFNLHTNNIRPTSRNFDLNSVTNTQAQYTKETIQIYTYRNWQSLLFNNFCVNNSSVLMSIFPISINIVSHNHSRKVETLAHSLLLNRIGNDFAYKVKLKDTRLCISCHVPETVNHIIFDCPCFSCSFRENILLELQKENLPLVISSTLSSSAITRHRIMENLYNFSSYLLNDLNFSNILL